MVKEKNINVCIPINFVATISAVGGIIEKSMQKMER